MFLLRVLVFLALAVDAVVHFRLAPDYQLAAPDGIGAGNLFRVQAVAAALAAVYVLLRGSRLSFAIAGLVALSALVPVVMYTYVDVPPLGPIPAMYEPVWHVEKAVSAIAEGCAVVLAAVGLIMMRERFQRAAR